MVSTITDASGRVYARTSAYVLLQLHEAAREMGIPLSRTLNEALEKELARRGVALTPISSNPKPRPDNTRTTVSTRRGGEYR